MKQIIFTLLLAFTALTGFSQDSQGFFDDGNCVLELYDNGNMAYQYEFVPILYHENESYVNFSNTELYIIPNVPYERIEIPTQQEYYLGEEIPIYLLTDGFEVYATIQLNEDYGVYQVFFTGTSNIVDFLSQYCQYTSVRVLRP